MLNNNALLTYPDVTSVVMFSLLHPCSACAIHIKETQKAINSKYGPTPFTVVWKNPGGKKDMPLSKMTLEKTPAITISPYEGNI